MAVVDGRGGSRASWPTPGGALALPLYSNGSESVGRWGLVVLLISDAVVIASFAFAYLFLWTAHPAAWPPDGSRLPGFVAPALVALLVVGAALLVKLAERFNRRDRRGATGASLVATALLAAGALAMAWSWLHALGIDPTRHSYGATVWALVGYLALHWAFGAAMALWCLVRLALGMVDAWRSQTLRICLHLVGADRAGERAGAPSRRGVPPCRPLTPTANRHGVRHRRRCCGCSIRPSASSSSQRIC